ncbi:class I SAM-dependent methyltransferase [Jiella sp. M17.18]|uniref:class I SAM-dependent methyltransferase n=1 Tax=Jiella sp. M17.18 TaxID=3234247 RepID=UPI0034DFEFA7
MTPLARTIAERIRADGPMRLDRFWNTALFDRTHGYYRAHDPFGAGGDFVTAPEISQIFGELIGAWIAAAWHGLGSPPRFVLAEIGPGRGTLMADILRTLRRVAPACLAAADIRLVETSERLAALQATRLERFDLPIRRVRRLAEIEAGRPLIVVANELFDALAVRQFVFDGVAWRERCVGVSDSGRFEFVLCGSPGGLPETIEHLPHPPIAGAVLELSPEREALAEAIAVRIATDGGAALFIDYGHAATGYGDTLQAVHEHAFADPLDRPGECDLTSHVDFERIGKHFAAAGLAVSPVAGQGDFLLALGLLERAGALGAPLDEAGRDAIRAAVARLAGTGETEMGRLFKVIACASKALALPPFSP